MTTGMNQIPDCCTAAVIDIIMTDDYDFSDNGYVCKALDALYNYIESKDNISVEGSIALLNAFAKALKNRLSDGISEYSGISSANMHGIGQYWIYFVNKADDAFCGKQEDGIIFEMDRFNFTSDSERNEYLRSLKLEYYKALNNAYEIVHFATEYPIGRLFERSKFSRKNVDYSL